MPIRICLVGAGHMGRIHGRKLASMKDVSLTSVVDVDRSSAEALAGQLGVPASGSYDAALADGTQGAVIASTTESHYAIARDFLKRGINVFVEKPIASEVVEAEEMVRLARARNLVLQVGHLERFSPPFRRALPLIDDPLSIETRRVSAFTGRSTDIDVVYDLMIHDIDLVMSLKKRAVRKIVAHGAKVFTDRIDVAHARIEFVDGALAVLTASRVSGTKERSIDIIQKDRFFSLDLGSARLLVTDRRSDAVRRIRAYSAANPDPVSDELKAFVKAVKKGGQAPVCGEDGLAALSIADTIRKQIEERIANERDGVGE